MVLVCGDTVVVCLKLNFQNTRQKRTRMPLSTPTTVLQMYTPHYIKGVCDHQWVTEYGHNYDQI